MSNPYRGARYEYAVVLKDKERGDALCSRDGHLLIFNTPEGAYDYLVDHPPTEAHLIFAVKRIRVQV